jgi:hypothetical protein
MIDPAKVCLWVPAGLKKFKLDLFNRIAAKIEQQGGKVIRHEERRLFDLPDHVIPIVGCHPPLKGMIADWRKRGRKFVYWDRGYALRIFSTWLKRPAQGSGYYRWEIDAFQMKAIRDVPNDRWKRLGIELRPWQRGGRHIIVAMPTQPYSALHGTERWTDETVEALNKLTDRPIIIRSKESKRPLWDDLKGAHCLVTHGSNAANEAVIMGCPVFVDRSCAASLVGSTDIAKIETPIYPDRQPWLNSLGYSQFTEDELIDGTMWRLIA